MAYEARFLFLHGRFKSFVAAFDASRRHRGRQQPAVWTDAKSSLRILINLRWIYGRQLNLLFSDLNHEDHKIFVCFVIKNYIDSTIIAIPWPPPMQAVA